MRSTPTSRELAAFHKEVLQEGRKLYRDLPWRHTQDPYEIWISEVMLQQTQVSRVEKRWPAWLAEFPTLETLATATRAQVLNVWQGMGYNRRALALLRAARQLVDAGASIPSEENALVALPGIGATTAAGIRAFAFDLPSVYLDTNVRSVFLYYFFVEKVKSLMRYCGRLYAPPVPRTIPIQLMIRERGTMPCSMLGLV